MNIISCLRSSPDYSAFLVFQGFLQIQVQSALLPSPIFLSLPHSNLHNLLPNQNESLLMLVSSLFFSPHPANPRYFSASLIFHVSFLFVPQTVVTPHFSALYVIDAFLPPQLSRSLLSQTFFQTSFNLLFVITNPFSYFYLPTPLPLIQSCHSLNYKTGHLESRQMSLASGS